jgi:hypothetical protein
MYGQGRPWTVFQNQPIEYAQIDLQLRWITIARSMYQAWPFILQGDLTLHTKWSRIILFAACVLSARSDIVK